MRPRAPAVINEIVLALAAIVFVVPVLLIFATAFKPDAEIVKFEAPWPEQPTLENFRHLVINAEEAPVGRWLANSLFVATSATLLVVTVDALAAFALARLRPPGSKLLFAVIVATMMVPGQVLLVPVYLLLSRLGWLDSYLALIVPPGAGAFGVFLLYQFFKGVPRELEEAAMLDGAGRLRVFWHVMVPLSRPVLATLAIFTFIGVWNDFIGPLIFLDSLDKYTLPVGIALFQSSYANEYGLTMATSLVCTLPVLIVFLAFNKLIIRGIASGALKE